MDHFIHLPDFHIIVCKECQYSVLPSHIDTHFTAKPHKLSKKEREEILEEVGKIDGLIGNEETLKRSEFIFPPPTTQPIAALGKPEENGLQCTICQYICCTVRRMRAHQWEEHQWKSQQKGRPKKDKSQNVPWRTGVHCQRFFKSGPKSGYFEVSAEAEASPSSPGIASRVDQFKVAKRELEAALRKAEEKERQYIEEMEESREPNPWLRQVGWAAHLAGLDREEVRKWVDIPNEEPKLEILCKAFDWMIQDAQYTTVRPCIWLCNSSASWLKSMTRL
jgi:hypothetical protein